MRRRKGGILAICALLLASVLPGIGHVGEGGRVHAAAANSYTSLSGNIYAPTELRMAPASNTDTTVVLVWEKPLFYANITKYNIYDSEGNPVGSTDKTYYKVLGLTPETSYSYTVKAEDTSGDESLDSNTVEIATKRTGIRFNVRDYGAAGDGETLDTEAIQRAIDAVTPGDTLYFPPGQYVTGGLFLHSHMTVYVDAGAQVMPSPHKADFLPFTRTRHSIEDEAAYQSLFNVGVMDHTKYEDDYSATDIAILGPGTIGDQDNGLALRAEYDQDAVELGYSYGGGHLLGFHNAHNIYLDGLKIRNGMMWTIVPIYSKDITAYNLDINTTQHNGDGFDPNSSENVYILNSTFQTGDDNSAIKSGINEEGRAIGRPSRFIYYRGETFNGGHGGVVIGSEMSGGVSDIFIEDSNLIPVDVSSNTVAPGFKVKTSTSRGGYIRNIQVRDSLINKIDLNSNYDRLPVPDVYAPDMSNFRFINLRNNDTALTGTDNIIYLNGAASTADSDNALKNVQFINCSFTQAQLAYTENIFFTNCNLPKGINATNSANIVQDGTVVVDKSFPAYEDFTEYNVGDTPGGYWSASSYAPGLVSIIADGDRNPNSLFLNDLGSGYVSASRKFGSQTGVFTAEVHMKFPTPQNVTNGAPNGTYGTKPAGNNRVFQLLSSTNKVAVWLNVENSGALAYVINGQTSQTIVPALPLDTWFTVKTVVDFPNRTVDVYYNDALVLSGLPFYDATLAMADISVFNSIGPNNNTTVASQVYLDNLAVTSTETVDAGYGINLSNAGGTKAIAAKGGRLIFSASKTTGGTSDVQWAVYNSDLTPTDAAVIDGNGVLTAKRNGKVVVTASMNDGTALAGMMPITITGQDSFAGYGTLNVDTTPGVKPVLPSRVPTLRSDGAVVYAPVVWDLIPASSYSQEGTFTVGGTVTGYDARAALQVKVGAAAVKGYQPVVATTVPGEAPPLPDHVTAILNNGATQSLPVAWAAISPDRYEAANTSGFPVVGTVQGSSVPVAAHIYVLPELDKDAKISVVAGDGTGEFKTIQAAIDAVPAGNRNRTVIYVKNGLYYEKVLIPETKPYLSLIGESEDGTILTYDDNPKKTALDGTSLGLGTYTDYTLMIQGHDFYAKNLTVINSSGSGSGQSVAVDVYADKAFFENCSIIGYQDTLLTRNLTDNADPGNYANNATTQSYRSYFKDCYIAGSVDFIFGPGIAVFDGSEIHSRLYGHVTAASTPQGQKYGYVFMNSRLTGEELLYTKEAVDLGRPWRAYAQTVYLNTYMEDHIADTGWNNFGNAANESTAYYGEYQSTGPGANPDKRLAWTHQLTGEEAQAYTLEQIFSASSAIGDSDDWDPTILASDNAIESIKPIQVDTPVGTAPVLPTTVEAVYQDGSTKRAAVVWDSIAPEQYAEEGRFAVSGTVEGTELKAAATIVVRTGSFLTGPGSVQAGQSLELVYGWSRVPDEVYALDLTLSYDPGVLQFQSAESLVEGVEVVGASASASEGKVRILLASVMPNVRLTGSLPSIVKIGFTSAAAAADTTAAVEATRIVVSDGDGHSSTVDGTSYSVAIASSGTNPGDGGDNGGNGGDNGGDNGGSNGGNGGDNGGDNGGNNGGDNGNSGSNGGGSGTGDSGGSEGGNSGNGTAGQPWTFEPDSEYDAVSGTVRSTVKLSELQQALNKAQADSRGVKTVTVAIAPKADAKKYSVTLPSSALTAGARKTDIQLSTPLANVTLPDNMLPGEDVSGDSISLLIAWVDAASLPVSAQSRIGNRPVIQLTLQSGGQTLEWNNGKAPVTVSIPYTPTQQELRHPEHIVVWYADSQGKLAAVPNGKYDAAAGTVTFKTTHFSTFAIGYEFKTFEDVGKAPWAQNAIEVLASKGIVNGVSDTRFEPSAPVTRADFLVLLVRTLELSGTLGEGFADVPSGAYYAEALKLAQGLGIAQGSGANEFRPLEPIAREDMMVLTKRALAAAGLSDTNGDASDLRAFNDANSVASYAVDAVAALMKAGLIHGNGASLDPKATTTRAEAAALMYSIYKL